MPGSPKLTYYYSARRFEKSWGGIHSRQFVRNLEFFVQCYSLSCLPSYLYTSFVFLVVEFSTLTADDGEGGFVYIFFSFWMCLVFKTHSVPTGNKISCSKLGPQLTVCTKHCILNNIEKCKQWNKTRQENILPYVFKNQYKKQRKTTARQETLRLFMNSAV